MVSDSHEVVVHLSDDFPPGEAEVTDRGEHYR
jgi:hypothetical protein